MTYAEYTYLGNVPQEVMRNKHISKIIKEVLLSQRWPDSAAALHGMAIKAFAAAGCDVYPEYRLWVPEDNRSGRIDLVIQYGVQLAAIEFDTRKPRARSVKKLRLFKGYRVVALRGEIKYRRPPGIDAVIGMPIRQASQAERWDKRTVNRP